MITGMKSGWATLKRFVNLINTPDPYDSLCGEFDLKMDLPEIAAGFWNNLAVKIEKVPLGGVTVEVTGLDLPDGFFLAPELSSEGSDDLRVGRFLFDSNFRVESNSPAHGLAILTKNVREALQDSLLPSMAADNFLNQNPKMLHETFEISNNRIFIRMALNRETSFRVRRLLHAASQMNVPVSEIPRRLRSDIHEESRGRVRLRKLAALLNEYPSYKESMAACRLGLGDEDAGVRFLSAIFTKEEGTPVLNELFQGTRYGSSITRAIDLIERGNQSNPNDLIFEVLEKALYAEIPSVRTAAIRALGRLNSRNAFSQILRLCDQAKDVDEMRAIIEYFESVEDVRGEGFLLSVLRQGPSELRVPAILSLAKVGTAKAVEPLLKYIRGFVLSSEMNRAAENALAKIQSRLGPQEKGTLSLSEDQDSRGAVSFGNPGGELSSPGKEG